MSIAGGIHKMCMNELYVLVYTVICGAGAAEVDARGEDVGTAHNVSASGDQCALLQPPAVV